KRRSLGSEASGTDHHTVETCMVVRRISISGLFWKKWTLCAPDQRRKGPSRLLPATKPGYGVWGCVSALGPYTSVMAPLMPKSTYILEQHMLPSRRHHFQGRPCIFQQDNAKPHSAHISKAWLRKK